MKTQRYNGNDVFAPFNAGLYGIDGDNEISLLIDDSKAAILAAFKSEYEKEITETLEQAGIRFVGLKYWSPREYNFTTDSIDLEIEIVDIEKLLQAIRKNAEAIASALNSNKSYDGYIALTADSLTEIMEKIEKKNDLDIIALTILLSGIDFASFDLYDHLEWDYLCETCELFHSEQWEDAEKEKVRQCEAGELPEQVAQREQENNLILPL